MASAKHGPVITKRFRVTREALETLGPLTAAELSIINGMEDYSPTTMTAWLGTSGVQATLGLTQKRRGREFVYSIIPPREEPAPEVIVVDLPEPAVKNAVLYPAPSPWTVPLAITIAAISAVGVITVSILTLAIINVLSYFG